MGNRPQKTCIEVPNAETGGRDVTCTMIKNGWFFHTETVDTKQYGTDGTVLSTSWSRTSTLKTKWHPEPPHL